VASGDSRVVEKREGGGTFDRQVLE